MKKGMNMQITLEDCREVLESLIPRLGETCGIEKIDRDLHDSLDDDQYFVPIMNEICTSKKGAKRKYILYTFFRCSPIYSTCITPIESDGKMHFYDGVRMTGICPELLRELCYSEEIWNDYLRRRGTIYSGETNLQKDIRYQFQEWKLVLSEKYGMEIPEPYDMGTFFGDGWTHYPQWWAFWYWR